MWSNTGPVNTILVKKMAEEFVQLKFRVSARLREELEVAAQAAGRSLTAEIVARLEASLPQGSALSVVDLTSAIEDHEKRIADLEVLVDRLEELTGNSWRLDD